MNRNSIVSHILRVVACIRDFLCRGKSAAVSYTQQILSEFTCTVMIRTYCRRNIIISMYMFPYLLKCYIIIIRIKLDSRCQRTHGKITVLSPSILLSFPNMYQEYAPSSFYLIPAFRYNQVFHHNVKPDPSIGLLLQNRTDFCRYSISHSVLICCLKPYLTISPINIIRNI